MKNSANQLFMSVTIALKIVLELMQHMSSFSTLYRKMYHMDLWDSGFLSFIWYVKDA